MARTETSCRSVSWCRVPGSQPPHAHHTVVSLRAPSSAARLWWGNPRISVSCHHSIPSLSRRQGEPGNLHPRQEYLWLLKSVAGEIKERFYSLLVYARSNAWKVNRSQRVGFHESFHQLSATISSPGQTRKNSHVDDLRKIWAGSNSMRAHGSRWERMRVSGQTRARVWTIGNSHPRLSQKVQIKYFSVITVESRLLTTRKASCLSFSFHYFPSLKRPPS